MIKITSQKDLDVFLAMLAIPEWEDAFVREWHILAPSYIKSDDRSIVAPGIAPTMRILLCTSDLSYAGFELIFVEVEKVCFAPRSELKPVASLHHERIFFTFQGNESSDIVAKSLYYRVLGKDCWDSKVRYSIDNIFEKNSSMLIDNL